VVVSREAGWHGQRDIAVGVADAAVDDRRERHDRQADGTCELDSGAQCGVKPAVASAL